MKEKSKKVDNFDTIVEIYAWLEVAFASVIVGLIIGLLIYYSKPNNTRLYLGIAIIIISLLIGVILANKTWKEKRRLHKASNWENTSQHFKKEEPAVPKHRTT